MRVPPKNDKKNIPKMVNFLTQPKIVNFLISQKIKKLLLDNVVIMIYVKNLRNQTQTVTVIDISELARA